MQKEIKNLKDIKAESNKMINNLNDRLKILEDKINNFAKQFVYIFFIQITIIIYFIY